MKRCLISSVFREMHIKATVRYSTTTYWSGYEASGTFKHYGWECKLVQAHWETVWHCLKSWRLIYPLPNSSPPWVCTCLLQETCARKFVASLFIIAQNWNYSYVPQQKTDKLQIHTLEFYSAKKKKKEYTYQHRWVL